jgi:hypothetical protein
MVNATSPSAQQLLSREFHELEHFLAYTDLELPSPIFFPY